MFLLMLVSLFAISGYSIMPGNKTQFYGMPMQLKLKKFSAFFTLLNTKPFTINLKNRMLKEASVQAVKKTITNQQIIKKTLWLGIKIDGRDRLSRLIIAAKISPAVGFVSVKNIITTC